MKTLFLVRHAKSSWNDTSLADFDRPLNARGKRDAPKMGERLAAQGLRPAALISSPALRALATARKISRKLGIARSSITTDERLYLAEPSALLEIVRGLSDELPSAMFFGHNPGLTELINRLGAAGLENLPTCGVAQIDFPVERWRDVAARGGRVALLDYPKRQP